MSPVKEPPKVTADPAEIGRALGVLFDPGDLVGLRAIKNRRCTINGDYSDFDKLTTGAGLRRRQSASLSSKGSGR